MTNPSSTTSPSSRSIHRFLFLFLACASLPTAALAQPSGSGTAGNFALYTRCSLRPQGPGCAAAYQKALTENGPGAAAVRRAFQDYAHYLTQAGSGLTAADRQFLADSAITLPLGLTEADLNGLHNVINDPALKTDGAARQAAVNNFLGRAVEAGLYCDLGICHGDDNAMAADKAADHLG